jgi:hypothetical protein
MPKKIAARAIPRTTPDATLVIRALMELSRHPALPRDHPSESTLDDHASQESELEDGGQEEVPTHSTRQRIRGPTFQMG